MTWKNAFHSVVKKEMQPMGQITYWVLFLSCGLMYVMGTVSGAAAASYALIVANPEIASSSWLVNGIF
jgi:TfoX/Sxy family transcriptional regulator of competence genes